MSDLQRNAFLSGLEVDSRERIERQLSLVELPLGQKVFEQGKRLEWVYFPADCLISLISLNEGGQTVETAMAGKEGAAGLLEACGSGLCSVEGVVQVDGPAWRAPAEHVRELASSDVSFNAASWRMAELQMAESRQSGLCHAVHPVQARAARWILESMERSGGRNPLPMTQEFMAAMLGVQRTTVSGVAGELRALGTIIYSRGSLRIVDANQLEHLACDCRGIALAQRSRLRLSVPAPFAASGTR